MDQPKQSKIYKVVLTKDGSFGDDKTKVPYPPNLSFLKPLSGFLCQAGRYRQSKSQFQEIPR